MKIGHAHLKVRDLKRAISFYEEFLGLEVVERVRGSYAFLTSGPMHHEIALHSAGPDAPTPPPGGTGLYPVAFEVPDKHSLADAYTKLTVAYVPVSAVDHVISWTIYFPDLDGNGLEIYWDTRDEPDGERLWQGRNLPIPEEELRVSP